VTAPGSVAQPQSTAISALRILATCEFVPSESCGGSDHVVWQVYRRIAAWGANVTILCFAPAGQGRVDFRRDGMRVIGVRALDLSRILRAEATVSASLIREATRVADDVRPTTVHANSLHFQSSAIAAMLARRRRLPLVTTAHIGDLKNLPRVMRSCVRTHERTMGRFILSTSRRVIAVSPSVEQHLHKLGVPASKTIVVPNGVDHQQFHPAPQRRAAGDRRARIAFVGRMIPNKGPDLFLEALRALAGMQIDFDAILIGDGPSRASLASSAVRYGLKDHVSFTGRVDNVAELLREVDVFVRPSLTEGMPLAVLEAMATGVCVVASDTGGNTDLIRHEQNGLLFRAGDSDDLATNLARVVVDRPLRLRLADAARACSAAHSWDDCAAATATVLLETGAHLP
jgi:glycosyltransferase involved in cell wall biosynthesis